MALLRYQILWFRRGVILFPTVAKTTLGLIHEVEPVQTLEPAISSVGEALRLAFASEPRTIPHPDPAHWPPSVVQRASGARSWRAFVDRVLAVAMSETEKGWEVNGVIPDPRGKETIVRTIQLPSATEIGELAAAALEIAEAAPVWKDLAVPAARREAGTARKRGRSR